MALIISVYFMPFCFVVFLFQPFQGPHAPPTSLAMTLNWGQNLEKFTHVRSRSLAVMHLKFIISSVFRVHGIW